MTDINAYVDRYISDIYSMWQDLDEALKEKLETVNHWNLSSTQQKIVTLVSDQQKWTVKGIARHLDISSSAVSQTITKMEQINLIKRTINPDNRREMLVELDEKGIWFKEEMKNRKRQIALTYLSELELVEIVCLQDIMRKMHQVLRTEDR